METTLCDWDRCGEYGYFSVGLDSDMDDTPAAGWGGHSYDACAEHFDKPIREWVKQWDRHIAEMEKEQEAS